VIATCEAGRSGSAHLNFTTVPDSSQPTASAPATDKRVVVAAPRGYCAGVDRAVVTVEKALETYDSPVYVRKQIVHNRHVVEDLESRGAVFVDELREVPAGATVVFSAHGVSPAVHAEAKARGFKVIDATCPLVTKVHQEAKRFAREGMEILLIGHAGHEEVEGTTGEAPDHITVVQSPEHVADLEVMNPPSDDICYATQNRQLAVKQIARHSDLVIVVGSANSSNSVRLVEVALEAGATAAYRVDNAGEIDPAWLDGVASAGVTSGASVPDDLVSGVLEFFEDHGFPPATEERLMDESLAFALPPELRKDLAGSR